MNLWKSMGGMLEVSLTSAEPEQALEAATEKNIPIYAVEKKGELTYAFLIRRQDYAALRKLCESRGENLTARKQVGLYWTGKRLLSRPVLILGLMGFLMLILYLPTRVLFVQVEGNCAVPSRQILAAAEGCGMRFGASRREVRSEVMKNALLAAVPELQWAGVNTRGCIAVISVRERSIPKEAEQVRGITHLTAATDGYVLSVTALRGTAMVQPGQTVRQGQLLISGYTDCGICIQAGSAEGEVMAQTIRKLEAVTPVQRLKNSSNGAVKKKYSLLLGKKRINLWKDSGISGTSCGRMYEEYYVTLPGGFALPIAICVERYADYQWQTVYASEEEANAGLISFSQRYLVQQMAAGQIVRSAQEVDQEEDVYRLAGTYICTEMISRVQPEQIGETNGKNN